MNTASTQQPAGGIGDYLWFLNTLVTIRIPSEEGADAICVIEHRVPHGDSPPLHLHRTEDEAFHILEGEFRFQIADRQETVGPGGMRLVPKGTLHTYRAESEGGGRFVTVMCGSDFEGFIRAVSRPAARIELPSPEGPPSPEAMKTLAEVAERFGIEFHGPPLG